MINKDTMNLDIEGHNYEIPLVRTEFYYPKHIQEETGILGYKRTKIDLNDLEGILKDYETGKLPLVLLCGEDDDYSSSNDEGPSSQRVLTRLILENLTNGEFPFKTMNHKLGAYYGNQELTSFNKEFLRSRLFLQKNMDLNLIENKDWSFGRKSSGSSDNLRIDDGGWILVNPENYEIIKYTRSLKKEDVDKVRTEDIFATKLEWGLNVYTGNIWTIRENLFFGNLFDEKNTIFGYGTDNLFSEISKKSKDIIKNIVQNNDDPYKYGGHRYALNGSSGWADSDLVHSLFHIDFINGGFSTDYDFVLKNNQKIVGDFYYSLLQGPNHDRVIEYDIYKNGFRDTQTIPTGLKYEYPIENFKEFFKINSLRFGSNHIYYPIFIGSEEVLQLRWGHAKYACLTTNNKANLIEFIHADKLPEKYQKK